MLPMHAPPQSARAGERHGQDDENGEECLARKDELGSQQCVLGNSEIARSMVLILTKGKRVRHQLC